MVLVKLGHRLYIEATEIKESFILRKEGVLERLTKGAEVPKGYIHVQNPVRTRPYVEEGNLLRPVDEVPEGKKAYEFKEPFTVAMKI